MKPIGKITVTVQFDKAGELDGVIDGDAPAVSSRDLGRMFGLIVRLTNSATRKAVDAIGTDDAKDEFARGLVEAIASPAQERATIPMQMDPA